MDSKIKQADDLQHDLRINDSREKQLWLLTVALLVSLGAGCVFAGYAVIALDPADNSLGKVAYPLLIGLAVLIGLFCVHVLQARASVSRVTLFLNEMSGMATGNLKMTDCLAALVKGFAATYRARFARFLIFRDSDGSVEIVSSHASTGLQARPDEGYAHAVDRLEVLSRLIVSRRPEALYGRQLRDIPDGAPARLILTGGLPGINSVLLLPVISGDRTLGFLVLGSRRFWWKRTYGPREISVATLLAGHAGTVIEEAMRRREAIRDPLTSLYNRRHFEKRIREEMSRASRADQKIAVLLCDLDRFKTVNDTRGHNTGDEVLKRAATAVRSATRGTDLHFRWGGDEMVIVLCNTSPEGVMAASERIRREFLRAVEELDVDVDMSIGAALWPEHSQNQKELVRIADLAMYIAKRSGQRVHVGLDNCRVDQHSVQFAYQPIYDARADILLGHEVFVRDPAGEFDPKELFRRYGAVGQLEKLKFLIFEQQLARAREAGLCRLFVNTDLRFLQSHREIEKPPELDVVLEVPDHDFRDDGNSGVMAIARWRRAGYRLAVAGAGESYGCLPLLEQLQPDYIKVARSCLRGAAKSSRTLLFIRGVLEAVRAAVPVEIIVEGIEEEADLEVARRLCATHVQGFLLGRPGRLDDGSIARMRA